MKKIILLATVLLASAAVIAEEIYDTPIGNVQIETPIEGPVEAPIEVIQAATEQCESWAIDESIEESNLDAYLQNCINQEVESQGYLSMETFDQ